MAHPFIKAACASAGLVLALAAAGTAQAAKPITGKPANAASTAKKPLSAKQRNDLAREMARRPLKVQPKTMKQAAAAQKLSGDGIVEMEVAEELHNFMSVVRDSKGNLHVLETDGNVQPETKSLELTHD